MTSTPRILDPAVETEPDLWPRQRAALRGALVRLSRAHQHAHLASVDLHTPADLARLPFTTKADLRCTPPLSDHGVPLHDIVRVHASSGTTGSRTISGYTTADLALWTRVVARGLAAVGIDHHSVVYSTLAHGLFTGGFGFHQAATALRSTVIPGGQAPSATHADLIRQLKPTVLFSTPSYAQHLFDRFGPFPTLRLGVFGAEPWSEADRRRLEACGMVARDTYGLSEIIGPGVAFECSVASGMHINADHFIPEVVGPGGEVLAPGEWGELVLSAPTREARPLIRYRTGDRTRLDLSPCPCGRTLPRMARVHGRIDDMKVVRGVNVRPADIASVLADSPAPVGAWCLELSRPAALDELTLVVETAPSAPPELARHLDARLRTVVGLRVELRFVDFGHIDHHGGKASRWVDRRSGASAAIEGASSNAG
jgi:phenylacetate-CoA ligase